MDKEWIKNLKAGDMVIVVRGNYYGRSMDVSTVEKITPSGLIKVGGILYKQDGLARGEWTYKLEEETEEVILKIKRSEKIQECFDLMRRIQKLSYKQAVAILNVLEGESE